MVLNWIPESMNFLVNDWFILVVLSIIFWTIDKYIGFRLLVVFAMTLYIHGLTASLFSAETITSLSQDQFNFPAASVQITAAIWGYLVPEISDRRFTILTSIVIFVTALFAYFDYGHSVQDILTGLLIGLFIVFVIYRSLDWIGSVPESIVFSFSLVLPSAMLLIFPEAASSAGLLLGASAGHSMEKLKVRIVTSKLFIKQAGAGLLGFVGLVLFIFIGALLPVTYVAHFLFSAVTGIWVTVLQPLLAMKIGLYDQESYFKVE